MTEREIFIGALQREAPDDRRAFLDDACQDDTALRGRIEELLRIYERSGSFLEHPVASSPISDSGMTSGIAPEGPPPTAAHEAPTPTHGTVIAGRYKLLEEIGEGGMGTVWMAEQTEPVQRRVAVKLIKPGMDSKQVVARFEAERQALALMDHPNIAKVFDGGAVGVPALAGSSRDEDRLKAGLQPGRPYFVMELVKGTPITKYCDEKKLPVRERLELFADVCRAVQHAHQKGIIHRDLKPSNVMVAPYDGKPVVKVIDFGVAKAAGQKLTEATLFTGFGAVVGTPEYMSPEQAEVNNQDIDTRSDIYSLGVLLYELLTGTTPLTKKRVKEAAFLEVLRVIREEEPPKPSTRLSSTEELPSISAQRQCEPAKLTRLVRGELDWIVMNALEKDRNRRYETANGFAMDVQRYLADEPVQACPPSAGYRLRKFVRRNKVPLAFTGLVLLILLTVTGGIGWMAWDRAAQRVRTAGEVNQFLQRAESLYADNKLPEAVAEVQKARGVLEAGSGDEELGRRVRQWLIDLDTAAQLEEIRLEQYDLEDPDRGYADYAWAFREYGIDVEALPDDEVTARVAASGIKLDLVLALGNWASRLQSDRRPQDPARWQRLRAITRAADPDPWRRRLEAAVAAKDVQTLRQLANGADPGRMRTRTLAYLGNSLRLAGDAEAAVAFLREAQRQHPGDFSINSNLALCLNHLKPPALDEVITFRRVALAVRPQSAWAHAVLGIALNNKDRLDEAIVEYREAVSIRPGDVYAHTRLGIALRDQKKLDAAVASFKKAIDLDPQNVWAHNNLGIALGQHKRPDEAIACYRRAIKLDPKYVAAHFNLGSVLSEQKKLDEAVAAFRKAIELDPKYADAYDSLGNALTDQGKLDDAIAAYRKAIELDPKYARAYHNLGIALRDQKKLDEAIVASRKAIELDPKNYEAYINLSSTLYDQKNLAEAIVTARKAIELEPKNARAYGNLGAALRDEKKLDEAIAAHRKAIELDPKDVGAHNDLGIALGAQGKLDEAIAACRKAIELDPKYAKAYVNLGIALRRQGKLDEAVAAYRKVTELDPKDAAAHGNLGRALQAQGKLGEAVAAYRKAIGIDPGLAAVHYNLGLALKAQNKLDEAIAAYRKAIELDPKDAKAHFNLGKALEDQGKLGEAIACFEKAVELDPKWAHAHEILAWVLTICPDGKLRNPRRGLEVARKAVELAPQSGLSWQMLGWANYRAGNWKASIEALEKSCALESDSGGDAFQWFFLAMAQWRLGEKDRARQWYDRAIAWMDRHAPKERNLRIFRAEATELLGLKEKE